MRENSGYSGSDVKEVQFRANLPLGVGKMKVPGGVGRKLDGPVAGEHLEVDRIDILVQILQELAGNEKLQEGPWAHVLDKSTIRKK